MIHYYHRRRFQLWCSSSSSSSSIVVLLLLLLLLLLISLISVSSIVVQSFTPVPIITRHRHRHCPSSITIIPVASSSSRSSSSLNNNNDNNNNNNNDKPIGIRLNKVFKNTHSRREADKLIAEGGGRITINNIPVTSKGGHFVIPYVDIIKLDQQLVVGWEELNYIERKPKPKPIEEELHTLEVQDTPVGVESSSDYHTFEYIKYWKPKGIICTTDLTIPYNIINELQTVDGYNPPSKKRIYPVGRLDKDTSGLILLTNDGRLPNSSLRQQYKKSKVYELKLNYCLTGKNELNNAINRLSKGVTITTETVRNGIRKSLTALTKPCYVEPIYTDDSKSGDNKEVWWLRVVLEEGRNRQVRKMINTIGYSVIELERVSFADITLDGLQGPGCWDYLTSSELVIIQEMIQMNASTPPLNEISTSNDAIESDQSLTTINNSDDNKVVVDSDDDDAGSVADDESESLSLNKLTIPQLKDKLRRYGRKVSGKKQDLIVRLLEASTTTEEESTTEESTASVASVASESAVTATATSSDVESEFDFFESISDKSLSSTQELATTTTPLSTHESTSTSSSSSSSPRRRTPQDYSNNDDDYSINENDNDYGNNNAIVGW